MLDIADPRVVVVDLEWVGGMPTELGKRQHVFQIAALHPCTGAEFSAHVNPRCPDAWLDGENGHAPQLSRAWLRRRGAVAPVDAWREFDRFLHQCDMRAPHAAGDGWVFLAHGAHRADQLVMWRELCRCLLHVGGARSIHWLDTLHFARWALQLCDQQHRPMAYSLASLAEHYGVPLRREDDEHDAMDDCRALLAVVRRLVNLPRAKGFVSGQTQVHGSHSLTLVRGAGAGTGMELARCGICSVEALLEHAMQEDPERAELTVESVGACVRATAPNLGWSDESSRDLLERVVPLM